MSARYRTRYKVVAIFPPSVTVAPEHADKRNVVEIGRNVVTQPPGGHRSAERRPSANFSGRIDIAVRADFDNGQLSLGARRPAFAVAKRLGRIYGREKKDNRFQCRAGR